MVFSIYHPWCHLMTPPGPPEPPETWKNRQILGEAQYYDHQGKNHVCSLIRNFISKIYLIHHFPSYGLGISAYRGPPFSLHLPPHLRTRSHIVKDFLEDISRDNSKDVYILDFKGFSEENFLKIFISWIIKESLGDISGDNFWGSFMPDLSDFKHLSWNKMKDIWNLIFHPFEPWKIR